MGKSPESKRLRFLVDDNFRNHPDILELESKGHAIHTGKSLYEAGFTHDEVDVILSRKAHFWTEEMFGEGLLEIAIKKARDAKKILYGE